MYIGYIVGIIVAICMITCGGAAAIGVHLRIGCFHPFCSEHGHIRNLFGRILKQAGDDIGRGLAKDIGE